MLHQKHVPLLPFLNNGLLPCSDRRYATMYSSTFLLCLFVDITHWRAFSGIGEGQFVLVNYLPGRWKWEFPVSMMTTPMVHSKVNTKYPVANYFSTHLQRGHWRGCDAKGPGFSSKKRSCIKGKTSCAAPHAPSPFVTRLTCVAARMWTIIVPAAKSSSGIRPSPYAPLRCCPSVHRNPASTPLSSNLMRVCRFLKNSLQQCHVH